MNMPKSTELDRAAAARLIRPRDSVPVAFAAGQPTGLLDSLGERTDLEDVVLYTGLLLRPYTLLLTSFA
ncbi:MAG: hypothetical protein ACREXU_15810 [Gammaproteobacteria bacterium]